MSEFEDFDLRFWVKRGLLERVPARVREFTRKRPNGSNRASVAVSMIAAIATFQYASPALASQVQSSWDASASAYAQGTVPDDLSLIPGNPQEYWNAMVRDISRWQKADESDPIDDVPPLF